MTPPEPTSSSEDRRAANEELLRARLERELVEGRDFVEGRILRLVPGLLGRVVNPAARALYHAIGEAEVRRRVGEHLEVVFLAARDVEARGIEAAAREWTPSALATEELWHRANRAHPRFPELERHLAEGFRHRLEFLARFLRDAAGGPYEVAVRAAFPASVELDAALRHQFNLARRATALVEEEPGLIRFPRPLLRPLFGLVRDTIAWYEARMEADLADIYGGGGSG